MSKYIVAGGAGFIGSNIVEELVARGEQVRVPDDLSTGRRSNIEPFLGNVELVQGSLTSDNALSKAVAGVDFIIHQVALPSVPRSVSDLHQSHEAKATGTLKLLIVARDAGVRRVVYASSSSVYGDSPTLPKREEMPTRPLSPYAVNKLAGEEYGKVFTGVYVLPSRCATSTSLAHARTPLPGTQPSYPPSSQPCCKTRGRPCMATACRRGISPT